MTMVAPTGALDAPYASLRPMRCQRVRDGHKCNRSLGEIDWSLPGPHAQTCSKCGAYNLVVVSPTVCVAPEDGAS